MAKSKALPKRLLVRWNDDNDEAFLEVVAGNLNDLNLNAGEGAVVGTYALQVTSKVRCEVKVV